jgi:transcriptional regulator with GAF, ATPase, and Fis domain
MGCLVFVAFGTDQGPLGLLVLVWEEIDDHSSEGREFLRGLAERVSVVVQQIQLREALQEAYSRLRQSRAEAMWREQLRLLG